MTLTAKSSDAHHVPCVLVLNDQGGGVMNISYDKTSTIRAQMGGHPPLVLVYDARENGEGKISPTITGNHMNRITDYTAVVVEKSNDKDVR